MTLICLHGFLGLARDWDFLKSHLGQDLESNRKLVAYPRRPRGKSLKQAQDEASKCIRRDTPQRPQAEHVSGSLPIGCRRSHQFSDGLLDIQAVDLWESFLAVQPESLSDWAHALQSQLIQHSKPVYVLGYSLGARLAAHMLVHDHKSLFAGVICVAGHLGLQDEREKRARLTTDLQWARRFLEEPWEPLMTAWNNQEVFKGGVQLPRLENDFQRKVLAQVLDVGSLGRQLNLTEFLRENPHLHLVMGEKDLKYLNLGRGWKTNELPQSHLYVIPGAGHRVPWDQPTEFVRQVREILTNEFIF